MDKYSYINEPRGKRFVIALGVGIAVGALYGLFYLWAGIGALRDLVGGVAAGATSGAVFGIMAGLPIAAPRRTLFVAAPISGAAGGIVWWAICHPEISIAWCAAVGAIIVLILVTLSELGYSV